MCSFTAEAQFSLQINQRISFCLKKSIMVKKLIYKVIVFITIVRGIKIKHTWNGKSPLLQAAIGENVSSHIYTVAIFSANPVTQTILDAANLRVRTAYNNRKANPQELIDARAALIVLLEKITVFADPIAGGNVAKIESAGFEATSGSRNPAVNPGRGNTPKAIATAGGNLDLSVVKSADASHYFWVIFLGVIFDIVIQDGHLILPAGNEGCILIPEGELRETLHGFAPRLQLHVGVIPGNSSGLGQMSVIVEFSTI